MINYKRKAEEKGARDFINKSVEVDELIERLERVYRDEKFYLKIKALIFWNHSQKRGRNFD